MFKRLLIAILVVCLPAMTQNPKGIRVITITAGTAQRIIGQRLIANSVFFQVNPSATGVVYVLSADPGVTCSVTSGHKVATLQPGTGANPGGNYEEDITQFPGGVDIRTYCVDGANSGDTVQVSWNPRN